MWRWVRRNFGLAPLGAVAVLAGAGQASATLVRADLAGAFYGVRGPAGWYSSTHMSSQEVAEIFQHPGDQYPEWVAYHQGGMGWTLSFVFDTSLGALSSTPGGEFLSWNTGSGTANPLVSATFSSFGETLDLVGVTGFSLSRGSSLGLSMTGGNFSFLESFQVPFQPPVALSAPYSFAGFAGGSGVYRDPAWQGDLANLRSAAFAPVAVVPEPATWAMLVTGFVGLGAALRRRRSRPATAAG